MRRAPLLLAFLLLASPAAGQEGVALTTEEAVVELVPSPERLTVLFRDRAGTPLDASSIRARILVRPVGGPAIEMDLAPEPRPGALSCTPDLRRADTFSAVLFFERGSTTRVLRFPSVRTYPPFLADAMPHETTVHGHVTPHDGTVEVFGDNHVELALEGRRLRLFWYDVAMNQLPATGLEACAWVEPCGTGAGPTHARLVPVLDGYLEADVPAACGRAFQITLQVTRGEITKTFRYRLPDTLDAMALRAPRPVAAVRAGPTLLGLRKPPDATTFPGPAVLELRILEERNLAPVDLRTPPRIPGLPPPLRLEAPGRWRIEGWIPPGHGRLLPIRFTGLDGTEVAASLPLPDESPWRRPDPYWLAGLLLLLCLIPVVSRRLTASPPDLVPMLGLRPLQTSRLLPALVQWPLAALLALCAFRLLQGSLASAWLLLGFLLPGILLSSLFLGRLWCSVCPFPALTDLAASHRDFPFRYTGIARGAVVLLTFLAVAMPLASSPRTLGWILCGCAAFALVLSFFFAGRPFCRSFCPVGAVLAVTSRAAPHRLETPPCPSTEDPGRWSTLSAMCCDCGRRVPSAVRPARPFEGGIVPGSTALLSAALLLVLATHPAWIWLQARGPLALALGAVAITLLPWIAGAIARSRESLGPLAVGALSALALPPFVTTLAHLPSILSAVVAGDALPGPMAPPLSAEITLSLQAGFVAVGAALSMSFAWRRLPRLAVIALLAVLLLAALATAFHAAFPLEAI